MTKDNYGSLERILSLCDELDPDFLHLVNYLAYDPGDREETCKIITTKDIDIIHFVEDSCQGREYVRVRPVYIDPEHIPFKCRSYDYKLNVDGEGNIGGCQRQLPPAAAYGNIFKDEDPFNSQGMRVPRRRMLRKKTAHDECRFCFGNWYA